ncbi:MAG: tetratricopeptide repeat protein [marine benthic group bacterium]|jgi:tetratricopeptide (TPR) repeat protein|nr:tetratricopeptide repeat protein [Gemmatimonadota bacterium]MCL7937484.1 tetratricopeptide repeat protein [Gemmatimonadota bacterium]MCL7957667.1 tetratricopeptide repeat protein [Gemmatimonadota bacterium]MCL7963794.1 tetratricopeptide repeat protein [Gemmatimonadota bacterium]MCL7973258.1 tetratricopeptide repeat protein [Gemmatimonadota bacterium]
MSLEFWGPDDYDRNAQTHYEAGDLDTAARLLREGVAIYPDVAELRVSLGYTELAREEYAWGRRAFDGALRIEADHEDALVGLGEALIKLGERGRGFRVFDRVVELGFSEDADLMISIGRILLRERLYERAERFLRLAVAADPEGTDAPTDLGLVLQQLGNDEEAALWFEKAIDGNPRNHDARVLHANLIYERGDRRGALAQFREVPPEALWDTLTIWRIVELERACENESAESRIAPYLSRLEDLLGEIRPEDRLIEEVVSELTGPEAPPVGQLDMFRPGAERGGRATEESGQDWAGIVRAMCLSSTQPERTIRQYMRDTADRIRSLTGIRIPDDDPEAFLKASATAGVLYIAD